MAGCCHKGFTSVTGDTLRASLAPKLIPMVDRLRDLYSRFGLRNIRVRIVRTRWSGGVRGEGDEYVVSDLEILPTPKVSDLSALLEIIHPVGQDEVGSIQVSEISARYTEDQLVGLDSDGTEPTEDQQVYYETETVRLDGKPGERRRFILAGVPSLSTSGLQWTVPLQRAHDGRDREGVPR